MRTFSFPVFRVSTILRFLQMQFLSVISNHVSVISLQKCHSLSFGFLLELGYRLREFSLKVDHLFLSTKVDTAEGEDDLLGGFAIGALGV